ncbi:hypothetical protein PSTG_05873 [Puccinia striiformis f. sp. tritici PST-78]|uniref:Uncharacterized protein n=1 Tax=Puccinia striiformis f. sp. tritici PST-78 TaxID=1165861 RepID=A0A0L0VPS2_9BASI|nr:hypothetical protein PSTG_05873 [Puccinia striiformis f. sp. tritici PST-78]
MESHEPNSTRLPPPAATTSGTSSSAEISHVPAQRPQSKLLPPTKRGKERAMAQPDLRRDGAHRPFPSRHIPTPRTRQDSPSGTQHAEPSGRTLSRVGTESPQSFYSSSKDAPDALPLLSPVPQHDRNIFLESPPSEPLESLPEEPSANELSLNSHWKQYLRAVHEQCVVGFQSNIKLHDMMVRQFRKITAHEDHRVDLEDYSLAEIKIRLSDVENKLDQLNVVIPQTHADMSGQISRDLNRVERMFEDSEDSVSKLHNKVHNLEVKLQEHHRDNRTLLEAQFNTFQDVLSRVKVQSVHASLTLNTLEAKLVSSMEHQLQRIQTSITCNCLNSNAHTACHQAPSQVNSSTPPGQEMSRISPPGEDIKIVPSISPTPAPQQTFNNQNTITENNASPCLSDITAAPWGSVNKDMHKMILQTMPKVSEWPTFSAGGEYNHYEFIEWIDNLQQDTGAPDPLIVSKPGTLLQGVAQKWHSSKRGVVGPYKDWAFWKEAIIERFSTTEWKRKVKAAFREDRFHIRGTIEPADWATKQATRIKALDPNTEYLMKLAMKPGDDLTTFVTQLESLVKTKKQSHEQRSSNQRKDKNRTFDKESKKYDKTDKSPDNQEKTPNL